MTIDYKQLEALVKEAMFTGGGINEPSAPEGVPHRMPAADTDTPEQDKGDPKANKLYDVALAAREAAEKLVEALDEPIYDDAYEHAFKASACLRKALNSLEDSGAHPMPDQRVVAPAKSQQPYGTGGSGAMNYYSMGYADFGGLEENIEQLEPQVRQIVQAIQDLDDEETKELMTVLSGVTAGIELDEQSPASGAAPERVGARTKKITSAIAGTGGIQNADDIKNQLKAVIEADGVNPLLLRDAVGSFLQGLGIKRGPEIGNVIAAAVKKKKQQEKK
mgnify:FL=1